MQKNIVITGANRGIGLALTKIFQQQGDTVFAVCRKTSPALTALSVNVGTTTSAPIPTTMAIPWSDPRRPPRILLANYDKDTDSFSECLNPRECVHKNRNGIKIPIKWLPNIKVKEIIIINNSGSKFVTKKIENITENIHGTFIKGYEGSNNIELRAYYTDGGGYYLMSNPLIVNVE